MDNIPSGVVGVGERPLCAPCALPYDFALRIEIGECDTMHIVPSKKMYASIFNG